MSRLPDPIPGRNVGRGFSAGHQAVDIPAAGGTPVLAIADGVVSSAGPDQATPYNIDLSESGGGNLVAVRSVVALDPGVTGAQAGPLLGVGTEAVHHYAHLSAIAAGIRPGVRVRVGQQLGSVGSTGNSTGNHLHLGLRVGGVWYDYRTWPPGGRPLRLLADPSGAIPGPPPDYGTGPVQPAPSDPFGNPVGAYPLDQGRRCAPGYRLGNVNPRIHGIVPGPWFNRETFGDGTILACVRDDLGVGDNAALSDVGIGLAGITDAIGDIARNGIILLGLLMLLILGAWALTRGSGGGVNIGG